MKYLIIDDEHMAHEIIKGYCDVLPNLKLMKHCYDALEALEYLSKHSVDLIFLDLNMPKLKGFEFLRTLSSPPKVIVTTAYQEFALEGYEYGIVDYLLKPFGFERLLKAVNKASVSKFASVRKELNPEGSEGKSIFLYSNKKYIQVRLDEILFVEAAGNYSKVVRENSTILVREKISDMLDLLSNSTFVQVHKSFIVAKIYIDSIEGNQISIGEHKIPIGKLYKGNINALLG